MPPAYYSLDYPFIGSHQQQFAWLNLDSLAQNLIFVHENLFLTQPNIHSQCQLLQQVYLETHRIPVICMDTNPFDNLDQLAQQIQQQISVPFFVLGCNARPDANSHSNVGYWPFWLIQQQSEQNFQTSCTKQHRISLLSGIPKPHRLKLFAAIKSQITDRDVVVVNRLNTKNNIDQNFDEILNQLPWSNHTHYLDISSAASYIHSSQQNNHAAYSACVNITAETVNFNIDPNYDYDSLHFISEKTWKAYRSGCLVINYGIDSLPNTLEQFGFQIWKDHDICGTIDQKIDCMVELFQRQDIFDLYDQHKHMVQHNQHLVLSQHLVAHMAESAIKKINCLLQK